MYRFAKCEPAANIICTSSLPPKFTCSFYGAVGALTLTWMEGYLLSREGLGPLVAAVAVVDYKPKLPETAQCIGEYRERPHPSGMIERCHALALSLYFVRLTNKFET